jgi:hypothetical protein
MNESVTRPSSSVDRREAEGDQGMLNRATLAILVLGAMTVLGPGCNWVRAAEDDSKTLSVHETVAVFNGTRAHQCLGMTSLCPNDCGQSGTMALFAIKGYVSYAKEGEYGDPKTHQFMFLLEDNKKNPKVSKEIADAVASLKPGDFVCLNWNHDYVTKAGSSYPERTITHLSKRTVEEAAKLMEKAEKVEPPPADPAGAQAIRPMAR